MSHGGRTPTVSLDHDVGRATGSLLVALFQHNITIRINRDHRRGRPPCRPLHQVRGLARARPSSRPAVDQRAGTRRAARAGARRAVACQPGALAQRPGHRPLVHRGAGGWLLAVSGLTALFNLAGLTGVVLEAVGALSATLPQLTDRVGSVLPSYGAALAVLLATYGVWWWTGARFERPR